MMENKNIMYIPPCIDWYTAPVMAEAHSYDKYGRGLWHNTIFVTPSEQDGYHVGDTHFSYMGPSQYNIDVARYDWRKSLEINPIFISVGNAVKTINYDSDDQGKAEIR